jgi:hypothetical protein
MKRHTLSSNEKNRLVTIILDFTDEPMEFDDFQENIGLLCEDIPGLECLSDKSFSALVNDCWKIYQKTPLPVSAKR